MIYRDFGEIKLSGLGLGMMRLPVVAGNDREIDVKATEEMVAYAMANGINYYDTAYMYHGGNSERVVGEVLSKYKRESFYLASKFPGFDDSSMSRVEEIFEEQLAKCQTPYFDFYLCHNISEGNIDNYLDPKFKVMDYLLEQKKNGRIKHLGFSAHGQYDTVKRFLDAYGQHMEFCQLQLNYMDWHYQECDKKIELCKSYGLPIWVMEPVRGGKLTQMPEDMQEALKKLRPQESVVGWAFRFLQSIPEVTMVLSGMSDMQQLKDNMATWSQDKPLNKEEFDTLVTMMDERVKRFGLPCTSCQYCTSKCPKQLPIPKIIGAYNENQIMDRGSEVPWAIETMPAEQRPGNCIGCRACEKICPQNIKIADVMREFSELIGM